MKKVRKIADDIGAVLIFDEISSGWRRNVGGAHLIYQVNPDMAVLGKSMSNGFPMAAIIGKQKIMDAAQQSFISSTYWTERIGPTAAIATIKKMEKEDVPTYLNEMGKLIREGWEKLAVKHGLDIKISGPNALITFSFNYEKSQELKTLFIQEMLKRGFLSYLSVYVSYAHKKEHIIRYLKSVDEVFRSIKQAITKDNIKDLLEGPVAYKGFERLVW